MGSWSYTRLFLIYHAVGCEEAVLRHHELKSRMIIEISDAIMTISCPLNVYLIVPFKCFGCHSLLQRLKFSFKSEDRRPL